MPDTEVLNRQCIGKEKKNLLRKEASLGGNGGDQIFRRSERGGELGGGGVARFAFATGLDLFFLFEVLPEIFWGAFPGNWLGRGRRKKTGTAATLLLGRIFAAAVLCV